MYCTEHKTLALIYKSIMHEEGNSQSSSPYLRHLCLSAIVKLSIPFYYVAQASWLTLWVQDWGRQRGGRGHRGDASPPCVGSMADLTCHPLLSTQRSMWEDKSTPTTLLRSQVLHSNGQDEQGLGDWGKARAQTHIQLHCDSNSVAQNSIILQMYLSLQKARHRSPFNMMWNSTKLLL